MHDTKLIWEKRGMKPVSITFPPGYEVYLREDGKFEFYGERHDLPHCVQGFVIHHPAEMPRCDEDQCAPPRPNVEHRMPPLPKDFPNVVDEKAARKARDEAFAALDKALEGRTPAQWSRHRRILVDGLRDLLKYFKVNRNQVVKKEAQRWFKIATHLQEGMAALLDQVDENYEGPPRRNRGVPVMMLESENSGATWAWHLFADGTTEIFGDIDPQEFKAQYANKLGDYLTRCINDDFENEEY